MELDIGNPDKMVRLSKEMAEHPEKFIGKKYVRKGKVTVTEDLQGIITAVKPKANGEVVVILNNNTKKPVFFDTRREEWAAQEYVGKQKCSIE